MELANFSMLTTMLLEVFSTEVAMLLAKSAPGIGVGFGDCTGELMLGWAVGFG